MNYPKEYSVEFPWNIIWIILEHPMEYLMKPSRISYGISHGMPYGTLCNIL
jgi:hypothetical protein